MTIFVNCFLDKPLQRLFVSNISHKMVSLLLVNYTDRSSSFPELIGNAAPDALRSTRYYNNLIPEIHISIIFKPLMPV